MAAGGADHGELVTTGTFTESAIRFARQNGIKLVSGEDLQQMISGITGTSQSIPEPENDQVNCPVCNSVMIKRTARKGSNAGQQFWGCSKFPVCGGTRSITY